MDQVKTIGVKSAEVMQMEALLRAIAIGETITYATMADAMTFPVQHGRRHLLASARKQLERESIVFDAVKNVGLRRLTDSEIVTTSSGYIRKSRSAARRGARRATAIKDYMALPTALKVKHNAIVSLCATIMEFTRSHFLKILEHRVGIEQRVLPVQQTVEHFTGK